MIPVWAVCIAILAPAALLGVIAGATYGSDYFDDTDV